MRVKELNTNRAGISTNSPRSFINSLGSGEVSLLLGGSMKRSVSYSSVKLFSDKLSDRKGECDVSREQEQEHQCDV